MAKPEPYRNKYRIRWTDHLGKRRCELHEHFRDAQKAITKHEANAEAIRVGMKDAPPPVRTFEDLVAYWVANRAIHKRSKKDDASIIRRHLTPFFGTMQLIEIGVAHIDSFRATKMELSPKTVSNLLTLLGTMLNAALDLGWLVKVPRIRKPKVRLFSKDFRYLRTDDEVQKFLDAARKEGMDAYVLYSTAIWTGMREGELAALTWRNVDLQRRIITVQASFDGPTKADEVRRVPILDVLLPILTDWRATNPCELVFPNRVDKMFDSGAWIFSDRMYKVLDAAGFERPERVKPGEYRHVIHFHSLRHTFASQWMMKGGDIFRLGQILGHKSTAMTMRYAHLAPDAFSADYGRFGSPAPAPAPAAVADSATEKYAKVIPITRKSRSGTISQIVAL